MEGQILIVAVWNGTQRVCVLESSWSCTASAAGSHTTLWGAKMCRKGVSVLVPVLSKA